MRNFSNTLILIAKRYQYFDPSKHHYEKHKIMSRTAYKEIEYARTNNVGLSPRVWRDDMSPANGSSTIASTDPKIAADLRPSADGSAVRTSLVAGGG